MDQLKALSYSAITLVVRLLFLIDMITSASSKGLLYLFIGIAGFVLTFLPAALAKLMKTTGNKSLSLSFIVFVFLCLDLGSIRNFYATFPYWDMVLHALAGVLLGASGLMLLKHVHEPAAIPRTTLNMFFIIMFALSVSALGGVLWEIFEFSMDKMAGLSMQSRKADPATDTMVDLIFNIAGAIIAEAYVLILKKGKGIIRK